MTQHVEFWADRVARLKKSGHYNEIIAICEENIPLPAALRELMIAVRKEISRYKNEGNDINGLLTKLYEIAVYHRFLFAYPTITVSKDAAFTEETRIYPSSCVAEIAHQKGAKKRVKANYKDIGYQFVTFLNKRDIKLLVATWGEPLNHADPRQIYLHEWNLYLEQFERNIIKSNKRLISEFKKLLR